MIIACKKCGRNNRIPDSHTTAGTFTCGACGYKIATSKRSRVRPIIRFLNWRTFLLPSIIIAITTAIIFLASRMPPKTNGAEANFPVGSTNVLQDVSTATNSEQQASSVYIGFSLPNGTELTKNRKRTGLGEISISNGSDRDAVVKLILTGDSTSTYRSVYICSNNSVTIHKIKPGKYKVVFCVGHDWNTSKKEFTNSISFLKFDEPFDFKEFRELGASSIIYSNYEITLHGVLNGNARTSVASKEEFDVPE